MGRVEYIGAEEKFSHDRTLCEFGEVEQAVGAELAALCLPICSTAVRCTNRYAENGQ